MADLAAKRMEARRRKILERSEDRLKKISGLYSVGADNNTRSESADAGASSTCKKDEVSSQAETDQIETREILADNTFQQAEQHPSSQRQYVLSSNGTIRQCTENVSNITNNSWLHNDCETDGRRDSSPYNAIPKELQQDVLHRLIQIRFHVVALAIIVRVLLASKYQFLVAQSASVPLIAVEFADILCVKWTRPHVQENQAGIVIATLILLGIPYRTLQQIRTILTVFYEIFDDFCIYFFAFVGTHVFLEIFT